MGDRMWDRDREDINMKEEEENRGQRINNSMQNAQEEKKAPQSKNLWYESVLQVEVVDF